MTAHVLTCVVGIFVAGGVSGATGVALPLIAGPLFLLSYSPVEAVALTALCSITGQVSSIALLRRAIAFEFRLPLLAAGLLGAPLGSALLTRLAPSMVHYTLGALIVLGGMWGLFQPAAHTPRPANIGGELFVGLTGGLTVGLAGTSAVVPALWCAWRGLSKEQQRAIMQPYILGDAAGFDRFADGMGLRGWIAAERLRRRCDTAARRRMRWRGLLPQLFFRDRHSRRAVACDPFRARIAAGVTRPRPAVRPARLLTESSPERR